MKKLLVMVLASLLLAACGGGAGTGSGSKSGPQKIELTVYGKPQTFEPKTGMMTIGQTGSDETYGEYGIHLGNVELKTSEDVNKTLTSMEEVRLSFALARKKGTDSKTPIAVETFPVNGSWPHINDASVKTFDGNRMVESWGHEAPNKDWKGEVKITAVNGDMVSGEVDLKFGDKISIKGPFTVKVLR